LTPLAPLALRLKLATAACRGIVSVVYTYAPLLECYTFSPASSSPLRRRKQPPPRASPHLKPKQSGVMQLHAFRACGLQLIPHMPPLLLALLPIIFHVGLAASPCNPSLRFHASFARALMISFLTRRLDVRLWSHF